MLKHTSPFVLANIEKIKLLCDTRTTKRKRLAVLSRGNKQLVNAVTELVLNCKAPLPSAVRSLVTNKKISLAKKRAILLKHWQAIRPQLTEVLRLLDDKQELDKPPNGQTPAKARDTGANAAAKANK